MSKAPNGWGTIEQRAKGWYWKMPAGDDGKRRRKGPFDSRRKAEAIRAAFIKAEREGKIESTASMTVAEAVDKHLAKEELDGRITRPEKEASRTRHIKQDPIGDMPVRRVRPVDVDDFNKRMLRKRAVHALREGDGMVYRDSDRALAYETRKKVLTLLRYGFAYAIRAGVIDHNPAEGARLPKPPRSEREAKDEYQDLVPATAVELESLKTVESIAWPKRVRYVCAVFLGARPEELFALVWDDVDLDSEHPSVTIHRTVHGGPPKNGTRRTAYLPKAAWWWWRTWRELCPSGEDSPQGLVFPGPKGEMYSEGYTMGWEGKHERKRATEGNPEGWFPGDRDRAGIRSTVTFRGLLRHTCATHLLAGTWGRAWSEREVQQYLGHKDVETTRRYARMLDESMKTAAAETGLDDCPRVVPEAPEAQPLQNAVTAGTYAASGRLAQLDRASASGASATANDLAALADPGTTTGQRVAILQRALASIPSERERRRVLAQLLAGQPEREPEGADV